MSTYWFFECLDHDPPLRSEYEFSQHTDDEEFREAVALASRRPLPPDHCGAWATGRLLENGREFLYAHPSCSLGLVNEYGDRRELDTSELERVEREIASTQRGLAALVEQAEALRAGLAGAGRIKAEQIVKP